MKRWISSKEFARLYNISERAVQLRIKKSEQNILSFNANFFAYSYLLNQKGGNSGKVARIWNEPFSSKAEAEAFIYNQMEAVKLCEKENKRNIKAMNEEAKEHIKHIKTYRANGSISLKNTQYSKNANDKVDDKIESNNTIEQVQQIATHRHNKVKNSKITDVYLVSQAEHKKEIESSGLSLKHDNKTTKTNNNISQNDNTHALTPFDLATTKARHIALEKKQIVKEWEALKKKGVSAKSYVAIVNANVDNAYTLSLSENKLYSWQRAYKEQGINGLLDNRGYAREGSGKIKKLGLEKLVNSIIEAQRSRINIANVHEMLHLHLHMQGIHDYTDFKLKNSEYISYGMLDRYIKEWKAQNKIKTTLIYKGEDSAIGNYKASLGKSNHNVTSINQVVEIDASPLDKVFDAQSLAEGLNIDVSHIESWQKRYVLISLVDTYSRVASFHISDTENSLGVARAVAKYILKYGRPKVIKGDNGKAFLSKYTKEVMQSLDIEYRNVKAYSGWLKPYVENTFRTIQDRVIAWGKGYIGHNVSQRQAIEFFFSKKDRRLKKGAMTNLKELDSFESMLNMIDKYATLSMSRYIDDLGCSPCEAYNAKANEAIAMNEYELIMKLSPSVIKRVNKKGIIHGGVWYSALEAFNYDKVLVRANINNTKELFIYDEKGSFIEIAQCIDIKKGVSAEVAKAAEKITFKRIKAARKDLDSNRVAQENNLELLITKAEQDAPKIQSPKIPPINNINIATAKLRSQTHQKAIGDDILNQVANEQTEKKDLSFFAAVIKNKKTCSKNSSMIA